MPIPKCLSGAADVLDYYVKLDALGLEGRASASVMEARGVMEEWTRIYLDAIARDFADGVIEPEHTHLALTVVCGLAVRHLASERERRR
jgi:hypothetical protein